MKRATIAILAVFTVIFAGQLLVPNSSKARVGLEQFEGPATSLSSEPVLIELFTSQGCSSCPPADRLAAKLSRDPSLVVISRPVDYWDRLGWKDTFAKPSNTALQRDYARRGLAGYNGVYTPQSVMAGQLGEVGSKEAAIHNYAKRAASKNRAVIRLKAAGDDFAIGLSGQTSRPAELMLIGVASQADVAIGRGENGGRTVTYTNVLIDEQKIGSWTGGTDSLALRASQMRIKGADRYALVLREPSGGPVLAARWVA
ncbi:MAG: DUF1223 domain-containing protein [Pseudomonadota bacterium]